MIDIALPRECVYQTFAGQPGPCPRCGGRLQSRAATYVVATHRGKNSSDNFIVGNDMGWFCARCPTVVINPDEVREFLAYGLPHWDIGTEFALLGIVNLGASPEAKRDLHLGDEDNPIPLVAFTNTTGPEPGHRATGGLAALLRTPARPGDAESFEERYESVLQNIEFAIVRVYRDHPELTDWDALSAVEILMRSYQAEAKGRQQTASPSMSTLATEVLGSVKPLCEWRLGREAPFLDGDGKPVDLSPDPITLDEMIACLKRIRKSINRWNREGGRQGYLSFVEQFIL